MGQESVVKGQWSRVTGQSQGSLDSGRRSLVSGQGSLVKPYSIIRPYTNPIQPRFGSNDILKTINFQVRDLDLLAMGVYVGGGGVVLRKTLDPYLSSDHI